MTIPRLAFKWPEGGGPLPFRPGLNVTVRGGLKWLQRWEDGVREAVILDGDGHVYGVARLVAAAYCEYQWLPDEWAGLYHDPACAHVLTLYDRLCDIYPGFAPESYVAVLFFEVLP